MKCSICGTPRPLGADRCPTCGCRFRESYEPEYKPHRCRGCCSFPVLVVALTVAILGYLLVNFSYLSIQEETVTVPHSPVPSVPAATVPSLPAAAEDCFAIVEGNLMFLKEAYTGGPVLQVPETVGGQTVTAIGPGCFAGCENLTTILLPETVTAIGSEAFAGCRNLRGLFVPRATEFIGKNAFAGCVSIESVYIPGGIQSIAEGCFDDCAALMFLFYEGYYADWIQLYDDYINPYTGVFCLDGEYYHAPG